MIIKRRNFIRTSLAASASLFTTRQLDAQHQFKTKLSKATIVGRPEEGTLRQLKDAGFDGVETTAVISETEAADCRRMADKLGMRIHSVLRGWTEMNSPDRAKVEECA